MPATTYNLVLANNITGNDHDKKDLLHLSLLHTAQINGVTRTFLVPISHVGDGRGAHSVEKVAEMPDDIQVFKQSFSYLGIGISFSRLIFADMKSHRLADWTLAKEDRNLYFNMVGSLTSFFGVDEARGILYRDNTRSCIEVHLRKTFAPYGRWQDNFAKLTEEFYDSYRHVSLATSFNYDTCKQQEPLQVWMPEPHFTTPIMMHTPSPVNDELAALTVAGKFFPESTQEDVLLSRTAMRHRRSYSEPLLFEYFNSQVKHQPNETISPEPLFSETNSIETCSMGPAPSPTSEIGEKCSLQELEVIRAENKTRDLYQSEVRLSPTLEVPSQKKDSAKSAPGPQAPKNNNSQKHKPKRKKKGALKNGGEEQILATREENEYFDNALKLNEHAKSQEHSLEINREHSKTSSIEELCLQPICILTVAASCLLSQTQDPKYICDEFKSEANSMHRACELTFATLSTVVTVMACMQSMLLIRNAARKVSPVFFSFSRAPENANIKEITPGTKESATSKKPSKSAHKM